MGVERGTTVTVEDIYEASGIIVFAGVEPDIHIDESNWAVFTFPDTDSILRAKDKYQSGDKAPLSDFVQNLRRLRRRMGQATRGWK